MKLNKSLVCFDEEAHTYTYDGSQLSGITGMIHRLVFPDMYKDVSEETLRKAAQRGTGVHNTVELMDEFGVTADTPEGRGYARLVQKYSLQFEASEYTVSDYKHYASNIDKVYRVDSTTFDLADIKTTYTLNTEYVRWQLSVYAYLFEMCNPCCKVRKLYAIWLRGDEAKLVEVDRIPVKYILKLMDCDQNGKEFKNPLLKFPADISRMTSHMARAIRQRDYWDNEIKQYKMLLERRMDEESARKWESPYVSVLKTADSEAATFDAKAFQSDYPELYKKYMKTTVRKGYVKITAKELPNKKNK